MLSAFCKTCLQFRPVVGQQINPINIVLLRKFSSREVKRFYKNVSISQSNGGYEINLDKTKLKTPLGSLFQVPTEAMALAVANEWQSQGKLLQRSSMHMTNLANTAIDNPTHRERSTVIDGILEFLATDTLCYRMADPPLLAELQAREWDPLIDWVKDRYGVVVQLTTGIAVPDVSDVAIATFRQHLESHSNWALVGYQVGVEVLHSLILSSALIDRFLTVEKAISLSRLEQEFQAAQWGNVEWSHDVDLFERRARLAAATIFVHLSTEQTSIKTKLKRPY